MRTLRAAPGIFALLSLSAHGNGPPRTIEVIADGDNTFKVSGQKKPVIAARPGEVLDIRITARKGGEEARDGAVHSFVIKKLRDEGWDIRLMEGTRDYKLVAPSSTGEYLIECTVKCGRGHEDMNMKLIVRNQAMWKRNSAAALAACFVALQFVPAAWLIQPAPRERESISIWQDESVTLRMAACR